MAIASYTDLKAAVADYLERSDFTSQIETFIQLAESRLSRELDVRTEETEASISSTPGSRFLDLPPDFRVARTLWIDRGAGRYELENVPVGKIPVTPVNGEPLFWSIDGTTIAFERAADQAYTFILRYLAFLDIASNSAPTSFWLLLSNGQPANYVLTNYPDLYLFGAMIEAGDYLQDDNMVARYTSRFESALDRAKSHETRNRGLAKLRTEVSRPMLGQRSTFNIARGW